MAGDLPDLGWPLDWTPPEADGAQGLTFPYRQPTRLRVSSSKGFQRGLRDASDPAERQRHAEWYFRDNGFASRVRMDAAHRPIVALAASALAAAGGPVLDLGCGNGALLRKLRDRCRTAIPYGVDADVGKIAHARTLLPGHEGNLLAGDLFDADGLWPPGHRYALALLMPGRLLEVDDERAEGLRRRLRAHVQRLLVYRYPGYDSPHADLAGLASVAGIRLLDPADADGPALATVV